MIWVILTAFAAVCGASKLDTNFLPPVSARTAGGSADALLVPLDGSQGLPTGGYTNDAQGVVVDAVNPGTRTSGLEPTGLGGPRTSYGSKDSKVGDAAFGVFGSTSPGLTRIAPGFGSFVESDDPQADKASGNSLKFTSDVGLDNYSYGFDTDNGISVGENGEAAGGVKAQGEYSYKGDDGKTYSVSYTADKEGYKPQGQHLPTPPPIPNEILISLDKNANEEAAGYVDDGSYTAQKYNDEGDSSNGAGNYNRKPTIGGGDGTSSGSYVSQSGQRPTSGILAGSYNPGSVESLSSQGQSVQGFGQVSGNEQSSFGINKDQSGSQGFTVSGDSSSSEGQFGQAGSKDSSIVSHDELSSQKGSSQLTESRFGVPTSKSEGSHAHAHASAGSPVRSPSIYNGASAFSSAVAKGSGSASAFASTAPLGFGQKNEYLPPLSSFGLAGQHTHGSDSSAGASFPAPSAATASASVSGSQSLGSQTHSHQTDTQKLPSSGSPPAFISGNQHSYGHLNQQQAVPSRFAEGLQAVFASSTQKPLISQQQGSDDSYYYKQPSKPFITPAVIPSGQYSIHRQPNTPATVATGQYQGTTSTNYNGITQASISPFPSGSSSLSSQFGSQSSQFGSKPSTQFGQTSQPTSIQFGSTGTQSGHKVQSQTEFAQSGLQAPAQFGSTETHSGHQTQSQTSQTSDSSKSPTQLNLGTSYQYNKPATNLSGNKVQGQTQLGQSGQQTSSQFGSTETHSGHKVQGQTQVVQSGLQVPTQFGSTETHFGQQTSQTSDSSHSPNPQNQGTIYQYNKPATTLPAQGHKDTSSFAQATATSGKPGQVETDSRFGTQQSSSNFGSQSTFQQTQTGSKVQTTQFGQKPIVSSQVSGSNNQFGSGSVSTTAKPIGPSYQQTGSQFGQNVQSSSGVGALSTTVKPAFGSSYQQTQFGYKPSTTQGSSFTYTQGQTSQYGNKPVVSATQNGPQYGSGSQFGQNSQFGSSGSQFGQNSQSTFGSGSVSTTAKPFSSSYQQTGSQFGQNVQSSSGAGAVSTAVKPAFGSTYQQTQFVPKPTTTQGSSFTYTQGQTSQYGKKPVVSATQTGTQYGSGSQFSQNSQFGSSGSQFGQNSQSTFGSGSVSTTAKPFGSSYQQTGSQFGQNVQSSSGAGAVSTTVKPAFGASYQQTGSQFGQNVQSSSGAGSVSTTLKPALGSSYQQTQFGYKPSTTQGSSFTYTQGQTSQYGKKPIVSATQTGTQYGSGSQFGQNSQFGSSGSQFGQNSQSTFGSGSVSTTAKPFGSSYQQTGSQLGQNVQFSSGAGAVSTTVKPAFGSSYQQTQFGYKPSTTQGSSFTYTQGQTSQFGKKPVVSATQTGTQFGSGSQFGQNSQSTFGSGSVSTTAKPIGSSYQQTGSQFGQNVQSSSATGSVSTTVKPAFGSSYQQTQFGYKPSTTQGSSFTYTQGQTSQFGKKPVVSATQTGTQFGFGSQFGQNSQSTFGSGSVSTTATPIGSSYQQTGSQFGQNVQSSSATGSVSTTVKPAFGSSYQQTQFGYKPSTTQGSSFTYTQGQTSQFGKKPIVSATQTGTQYGSGSQFGQNSQFGSSGSQFGQNSQSTFGSGLVSTTAKPFGSSYQQTGSQLGQNVQSSSGAGVVSTTVKPAFGSSYQQTQFGYKPSTTQGSSFTYTQGQTSQFGKKPVVSATQTGTQFGSGSQFGQNSQSTFGSGSVSTTAKPIGSSYQQTGSQFGQNVQSSSATGSVSTTVKPAFGSSYQQTQFGYKPSTTQGSSFTYTQGQTSQFGKKPVVSATQTGTQFGSGSQFGQNSQSTFGSGSVSTTAKPIGSSYQQTGSQFGQNVQSSSGAGSVSTTLKPAFGSSYQQTQFGYKPSTTQGSSFTYTQGQTSQFGKKPIVSATQTGTQYGSGSQFGQNSQFGSSGSQFGQNSQSTFGSGSVSTTAKPIGSSYQQTGSQFGQNVQSSSGTGSVSTTVKPAFGSSYQQTGSQFGQNVQSSSGVGALSTTVKPAFGSSYQQTQFGYKPSTTQGSSFTYTQTQTSQYGKKPIVSATQTGTQYGSGSQFGQNSQFGSSGSQFGQNSQSTFGSGSVSTTAKPFGSSYQQTGSQFGQNVQSSSGAGAVSTAFKPAFGSTYQQTQFGPKPTTTQGSSFTYTQGQTSQYGNKPVVSTTQSGTQFGSGSQFGQNSQFGSSGSQFGQNSQSTFGSGSVSTTAKPIGSSYQQTQIGYKPSTNQGSSYTYTQSQTSQYGKKPVVTVTQTGTQYESGSQFGQNSQSTPDSAIALTTSKPVVGIKPVYQQAQFGSSGSQFGQNSQSSQEFGSVSTTAKPAFGQTSFGLSSQNTQFGSSGSQFVEKPQTTQGSSFTSNKYSHSQTTQFGKKPETGSAFQQTQFGSTGQFGQKPVTTTGQAAIGQKPANTGSNYQQSQFGSSGSQFVQKPQSATQGSSYSTNKGSAGEAVQTTQSGVTGSTGFGSGNKVSGLSSTSGSSFQQTQFAGTSGSQIGQTTQYGIKPFGSAQATQGSTQLGSTPTRFGESSQTIVPISTISQIVEPTLSGQKPYQQTPFGLSTFAASSGSNVAPFSSTQTGQVSKYQTSEFGAQNQGIVSSTQKPVGSSVSQSNYQQYQYTQNSDKPGSQSQFGQGSQSNVGSGQIGQTTFGQKPFGSSQGSGFQIGGQSIGGQPSQGTGQTTSVTGYNYQKPQSVFTTQYGSQSNGAQVQKVQQSQTNFNSAVSTVQTPINGQPFPFGVPSTQGTFQQGQSTVSSSLFGAQAVKPTEFTGPVIQTSYNKFSGKPFQPASSVSTVGSNVQSQSSAVSSSLFGLKPTPSAELAHFSGTPEYSILPSYGVTLNPSVFSSTQAPSRLGSNEGLVVSTVQTPIESVPGYELVINEGTSANQGLSHSFLGLGEQFGGPRDPPRFDDKTGYHY